MNIKRLLELSGVSTDKKEKTNLNEHIIGGMMDVSDMTSNISESGWNDDFDPSEDYPADNELRWSDYFDNDREAGIEDDEYGEDDHMFDSDEQKTKIELLSDKYYNLMKSMTFMDKVDFLNALEAELAGVIFRKRFDGELYIEYIDDDFAREYLADRLNEDVYDVQIPDEDDYDLDDEADSEDFEQFNFDPYAEEEYVSGPESFETIETDDAYELAKELMSMGLDEDSVMMAVGQQYGLSNEELISLKKRVLGQGDDGVITESEDILVLAGKGAKNLIKKGMSEDDAIEYVCQKYNLGDDCQTELYSLISDETHQIFENKNLGSLESFAKAAREIRSMVKQGSDIDESIDQVCSQLKCEASKDLLKEYVLETLKENKLMENPLVGLAVRAAAGSAGTQFANRAADKIFGSKDEDLEENTMTVTNDRAIIEKYFDLSRSLRMAKESGEAKQVARTLMKHRIERSNAIDLAKLIVSGRLEGKLNRIAMRIAKEYIDGDVSILTDYDVLLSSDPDVVRLEAMLKSGNISEGYIDHEECEYTNMLDDEHYVDGDEYFPDGAHHSVTDEVGPSSAKQGDNSMQKRMAVSEATDIKRDLVYKYRKFLKESK